MIYSSKRKRSTITDGKKILGLPDPKEVQNSVKWVFNIFILFYFWKIMASVTKTFRYSELDEIRTEGMV